MNKPMRPEENLPPIPQTGLQQHADNSVLGGGMQAVIGDENIQIQGDGNTITQTKILQISVEEIKTRQFVQTSPYKGLKKFEPEDKDLFFGRDQFITQLVKKLEDSNLILLLGASGSGKSSVVRAGLIPWLSRNLSRKWGSHFIHLTFTPDQDPFESLYASLLSKFPQKEAQIAREAKADTVTQVVTKLKQSESFWFIFIDQFEELFTTTFPEKRDQFINGLVKLSHKLSQTKNNSVKIMGTMRVDFLDKLSPYPQLIKTTDDSRPMLAEMQLDELRLAIEQPAAHHGVVFETGLVEEIIKNVQGQAGYLPLLQYTLNLLWETEVQTGSIHDRTLNTSTYRQLGGVRGALQQRVEGIYNELPEAEKRAAQRVFLKLVGINENSEVDTEGQPVLRRALRSEFSNELEQSILVKLIDENLLVSDRQPQSQESTVEIAHEMLLTSWTTLNDWIKENRLAIVLRNRLYDDVPRWQGKKAEDELWAGSKLEKVVELRNDATFNQVLGGFNETASQFIDASVGLRDRQRRRAITGLASFSTVALLVAGFAVLQWQSAEQQRIEQAALATKGLLSSDPLQGLVNTLSLVQQSRSPIVNFPNQPVPLSVKDNLFSAVQSSWEKNVFKGRGSAVFSAISADGRTIASGGIDGIILLWDSNGKQLAELKGSQFQVTSVAISADGQRIVSYAFDRIVRLWDRNGKQLAEFRNYQTPLNSLAISADGQRIVTAGHDGTVRLWDSNGKLLNELKGHKGEVSSVAISTDGRTIVSGGQDATVRLWSSNGKELMNFDRLYIGKVRSVAISADGQSIVSGGDVGMLWFLDINRKKLTGMKTGQGSISSVAISADGQRIVSGGVNGTVRLWGSDRKRLAEFRGNKGEVTSVAISADGQSIVSGGIDGTVRLWDSNVNQFSELGDHQGSESKVAISTNKGTIVRGGSDGTIQLWSSNGKQLAEFRSRQSFLTSVAISADGQSIVTGGYNGTVQLSNNGMKFFGPGGGGPVQLWSINGNQLAELRGHNEVVNSVAISTDGQRIVSGGLDGTVRLWSSKGKQLVKLEGDRVSVWAVAISTDKQTIVSGGEGGIVRLWSSKGERLAELRGHQGSVNSVAISTDGQTIVSGGSDGTVRLWSSNGKQFAELRSVQRFVDQRPVNSVAISTDGRTIVSGGDDGIVRLWDIQFESWLKVACKRLQDYPVFKEPKTPEERGAKATCEPYLKGL